MTNPLLHDLWRRLPRDWRRRVLYASTTAFGPKPVRHPPAPVHGIAVAGEIARASGLGEVARLMLRGLHAVGQQTWPIDIGTAIAPSAGDGARRVPPGAPLLIHVNPPLLPLAMRRLPRAMSRDRRVIGYWAWELPAVPPGWRAGARYVHEAWVLSRFTRDALDPLLPGRVRVVTPPVGAFPPRPAPLDRGAFGLPADAVVVLTSFSLASSFARKNPLGAIEAFRAAFGDRSDRLLLLKVHETDHHRADADALRAAIAGAANIRILTDTLPAADSHALTQASDIVLSLHRSEGFGLVPAEAMLLKRPVVATGWSGNMDFMDEESAALVPSRLIPARDPRGVFEAPGAVWAEPDIAAAAAHLRRLAGDDAARAALGARAAHAARTRLGLQSLTEAVAGLGLAPAVAASDR